MKSIKEYMKQTSRSLRSKVIEDINSGAIEITSGVPKSISRAVAYMKKEDCAKALYNKEVSFNNWDDEERLWSKSEDKKDGADAKADDEDYKADGKEYEADSDADSDASCDDCDGSGQTYDADSGKTEDCDGCDGSGPNTDTDAKDDSDADSDSEPEPEPDADYKLCTDVGTKGLDEVKKDMKIDLGESLDDALDKVRQDSQKQKEHISEIAYKTSKIQDVVVENCAKAITDMLEKSDELRKVEIVLDGEIVTDAKEHYHPKFETILRYAKLHKNVMLVGESGTGKSHVSEQVAKALKLDFRAISCTMGMSESHLLGRMLMDGSYVESDFVRVFENGGVFLFDEFDALDSNMFCVVNSALSNGYLSIPNRAKKQTAYRHKDCIIIACGNTWGQGQGSRVYSGRNQIDGATLDRFAQVNYDYDNGLERKLVGEHIKAYDFLIELRDRVKAKNLQRIVSTRKFISANKELSNGISLKDFADGFTSSWTDKEKEKVELKSLLSKFK